MDVSVVIIIVCAVLAVFLVVIYLMFGRTEATFTLDIGGQVKQASDDTESPEDKTIASRLWGFAAIVGGIFAVLVGRLWSMQLLSAEDWSGQAESNRTSTVYTRAPRGRILDRNGVEIVGNRASLTVVAEADVVDDEIEVQLLANLIGMPYQAVRRKLQDTTEGYQSLRTVSVDVSRRVIAYIGEHPDVFSGVSIDQRTQRSYPYGSLASHVVGYTGTVTADQLAESESSEGVAQIYHYGDTVGQAGVELTYESVLQGIRGEQTVYVDASGNVLEYATNIEPQSGSDLVLTLDLEVQKAAEDSILRVAEELRAKGYKVEGASVVAVDCTNGEVIALASYPTYSPSLFVGGISTADWDELSDELSNYPLLNRAIAGQYPSGSTMKPLTTFAALDYGVATAESSWYCTGWWSWSGSENDDTIMKCWWENGHGAIDLVNGITYSCDVVFYEIGKGFYNNDQSEGMQETFRRYGLGSQTGIDIGGEAAGRVPDAEWKWNYWEGYDDDVRIWRGGDNCNIAIGQGDILVTCLQMVCAYCSIANAGDVWRPHLMKGVRARLGDGFVLEYKPEVIRTCEEPAAFREIVHEGMYGVVYEEDAAQTEHWTNLDIKVCGKTGTAQHTTGDPVGWFIGFGPADDPKYVVGANMDRVLNGATSAMYVVRDVFGAIYGQPDTATAANENAD